MRKLVYFSVFAVLSMTTATAQEKANDFTATDVHGHTHNLYSYLENGKHVVLDFFYTTCAPCIYYSPQVNEAYAKYGCNTADVVYIAIDFDDTDAEVKEYDEKYEIEFPSISGKDGGGNAICASYGVNTFPRLLVISPEKEIVAQVDPPTVKVFDLHFENLGIKEADCTSSGIAEVSSEIDIYPNPTAGALNLTTTENGNDYKIIISQINGDVVYEGDFISGSQVDLSQHPRGVYMVMIVSDEQRWTKRILLI